MLFPPVVLRRCFENSILNLRLSGRNFANTHQLHLQFYHFLLDDLGEILSDSEGLEMQSVKDDFASLGCFDPGGRNQQVEVLQKDVLPK